MAMDFSFDSLEPDERDYLSQLWSDSHAENIAPFDENWDREQKDDFYQAFVEQWLIPNDERDFEPTYEYLIEYEGANPHEFDDDPYSTSD